MTDRPFADYKWALVTGASSGIGKEFARRLASMGMNLVLVARSEDKLSDLSKELNAEYGIMAEIIPIDLTISEASNRIKEFTDSLNIDVDVLVNNAGFGLFGDFERYPPEEYTKMIRLNIRTLTELCSVFLPEMRKRGRGGVINVASTAAFMPIPYLSVYSATKAYVLSLSQALWAEYRKSGVRVTCLAPGATKTNFFKVAGMPATRFESPEIVVERALKAFEKNKRLKISGAGNYLSGLLPRFLPHTLVITGIAKFFKP